MSTNYNYLSQIQKYKIALSTLFKNTTIIRYDDTGAIIKQILVPIIGNSSNTKYYDYANNCNIRVAENLSTQLIESNILLPQMVISIISLKPDLESRGEPTFVCDADSETLIGSPHILEFTLTILTRRITDSEIIIEQIISSFLGDKKDIKVNISTDPEIKVPIIIKYDDLDLGYENDKTLEEIGLVESTFYFSVEGIKIFNLPTSTQTSYDYDFEISANLNNLSDIILKSLE